MTDQLKRWEATEAKRHFSSLIKAAREMPQVLMLRGKPVSVVLDYDVWQSMRSVCSPTSMDEWLAELAMLPDEGDFELEPRKNRPDALENL